MQRLDKKGAIELSIGTIVIIVIALTLLIFAIYFVKNIMCAGIVVSDELSSGVKDQVRSLFGADKYGVRCVGEGGQELKFGTGGRRQVICIIKTEEQLSYALKIKSVENIKGSNKDIANTWIIDQDWEGDVSPGGEGSEAVVMVLDIPKTAPASTLKITIEEENLKTASTGTHISYVDIVPTGFFKTTLC